MTRTTGWRLSMALLGTGVRLRDFNSNPKDLTPENIPDKSSHIRPGGLLFEGGRMRVG
jgi:hypothetical protein